MRCIHLLGVATAGLLCLGLASSGRAETLVVANKSDHTVDLIDLSSGSSVATLPTGHAPHEVAVSPQGTLAVISNYGDREDPGSSLTVIDVERAEVMGTVELGRHTRPHGLAWVRDHTVAVTAEGSAHLVLVDVLAGKILQEVATGRKVSHMVAVTSDGRRAFVANIGSGNVTAVDLIQGAKLTDIETGEGAEGIAITPDGKELWVTNRAADTLSVISPETLQAMATVPCPGFPIRISVTPNGDRVLVSAARTGEVVVFDARTRSELVRAKLDLRNAPDAKRRLFGDRFGESPVPVGLVIAPSGDAAWVAATQADVIVVVDSSSLAVVGLLEAGREPDGMAYSPLTVLPEPGS